MPISDIVTAMIQERDRLDRAIAVLSPNGRVGTSSHRADVGSRRRKPMSLASRKALSAKLRASWAKRKKAAAATAKKS